MTDLYGLVGKKLSHSFSADFFNKKFEAENVNAKYINFELESIDDLIKIISCHPDLQGLNITVPYKESVIRHLDYLEPAAKAIGAVNVVEIRRETNGRTILIGHNTDAQGFNMSILPVIQKHHNIIQRALILGTGGASKAVRHSLEQSGIETSLVSRTPDKYEFGYNDLTPDLMRDYGIIVNTTPLGMYPDVLSCPPIDYRNINPSHLCFDLIYNPAETVFLKHAREAGAITINGLEMLHNQALLAWSIWQTAR